jgi:hypothetical protein
MNNSWWWTEELSETCTISFRNKFEKLVRLVGFITVISNSLKNWQPARPHSVTTITLSMTAAWMDWWASSDPRAACVRSLVQNIFYTQEGINFVLTMGPRLEVASAALPFRIRNLKLSRLFILVAGLQPPNTASSSTESGSRSGQHGPVAAAAIFAPHVAAPLWVSQLGGKSEGELKVFVFTLHNIVKSLPPSV